MIMPPVGVSLLVACSVGRVEPAAVSRHLWPYLVLMLVFALLIAVVPVMIYNLRQFSEQTEAF